MDWPIHDLLVENRPNQSVLHYVRIEMPQQSGDSLPAPNSIIKAPLHLVLSFFSRTDSFLIRVSSWALSHAKPHLTHHNKVPKPAKALAIPPRPHNIWPITSALTCDSKRYMTTNAAAGISKPSA
jgi:hypothetical protein